MEALKILSGYGEPMRGKLLVIDLRTTEFRALLLPVREDCPACAQVHR
jgi:adenylyltransferase/sulfurtransferase